MDVAAVLIYDRLLDAGELATVEGFLQTKYIGAGNTAPVVTITAPSDGTSVTDGDNVAFTATVVDVEEDDSTLEAALSWSSDIQAGFSGAGASFSTTSLIVGVHQITAEVTDGGGMVGGETITVTLDWE